ncbi:hypothetical protein OKA04_07820 [Luteolibacter flavescens]|uniref:Uncharacterized protein n=1 Tax=Luteolibacter flavescens TaxID=1859460 RepID=A0ABT3FM40_9BACT|nr:hypothetical protein [Luteolibacter flavescens]MCW1884636.1 hypothetical protein [Luteolibacter flavescens]
MHLPTHWRLASWLALLCGLSTPAIAQTRHPVISRVEIMFSVVSHYSHISDRVNFYNSHGVPRGNTNYAVPHLVYDPIVTLYNPYNTPLTMTRSRIKIWDPPIGFAFKKNDAHLRDDFAEDKFHGLARFQIQGESDPTARKTFTLSLSEQRSTGQPGGNITLQPGESRTFYPWVETNWTWGQETAGGLTYRSFFDWSRDSDFTNRDPRTGNLFGTETISRGYFNYPDFRAGFQTDGLSLASGRPQASRYDFEIARNWTGNWVGMKFTDIFSVRVKPMRTNPTNGADFQVDLLKGQVQDTTRDGVKAFPMDLANIIDHTDQSAISRRFRVGQILQTPTDSTIGGKSPFASLIMIAKASALRGNHFYTTPATPASDLYELHFAETMDFSQDVVVSPGDIPVGGPVITGYSRIGDKLYIDFSGQANRFGISNWKVRGTDSLEDGFRDDLGSVTTVMAGMSASGIYKAIIDISGRGDRYFVRIEE